MEDPGPILSVADDTIEEILQCIRPTLDSEEKRKDIVEYIRRLIQTSFGLEVFPYGSMLLKTYLPDGDIDITVIHNPVAKNTLPQAVHTVLLAEEKNEKAEFKVRSTIFIDAAEVKIIKCVVQKVPVDISFNQLGGLSTLCFLEKVDRVVGKNHLFKRSFILIKAWCYYESRTLGGHNGLISTYALEVLVLYIFNMFNKTLNNPLEVLYRFLDYFSKFDWNLYGVSLKGPILRSALPDIVVEKPVNWENDVLFNEDFVRDCMDIFTITSRSLDVNLKEFPLKFFNIVDPLKETNNIGRSVNKGNFERIRGALKYGAKNLGQVLQSPSGEVVLGLKKFFSHTIRRHGHRIFTDENLGSSQLIGYGVSSTELDCRNPLANITGDFDTQIRNLLWAKNSLENIMYFPAREWVPLFPYQALSLGMTAQSFPYQQNFFARLLNRSNSIGGTQPFIPRQNASLYTREKPQSRHRRMNCETYVQPERRYGTATPVDRPNPNKSHWEGASSSNFTFPTAPTLKNMSLEGANVTFPTAPIPKNKSLEGARSNVTFSTVPTLKENGSEGASFNITFPTAPTLKNKGLEGASSTVTIHTAPTLNNNSGVLNTTRSPLLMETKGSNSNVSSCNNNPNREKEGPFMFKIEDFPPLTH